MEERVNANKKLRCEIEDLKLQVQKAKKKLATMKLPERDSDNSIRQGMLYQILYGWLGGTVESKTMKFDHTNNHHIRILIYYVNNYRRRIWASSSEVDSLKSMI
ncbi:10021_t:CDS:1 [Acaulospora colombiana]|uniref:10021_t:CDS:1 n=1 Tax=Acaulospora colombiana TaxID=27376 RepID=A0ACA9LS36_9GLOM|nr:10021_t:CDS:1 [Acaulospora colombiana]